MVADGDFGRVHIFLNRANGLEEIERSTDLQLIERHAFGDIDGDGKPSIVIVENRGGGLYEISLDGGVRAIAPDGTLPRAYDTTIVDVDRDGKPEIAASNYVGNEFRLYKRHEDGTWSGSVIAGLGSDARTIRPADFDGDGDLDLLATARASGVVAWIENRDGTWITREIDHATRFPNHAEPVDLDGDGDPDIVLAAGYRPEKLPDEQCMSGVFWYENLDGGRRWQRHIIHSPFARAFDVAIDDIDGDGDLDVAATSNGYEGRLSWFENQGNPAGVWNHHDIKERWPFGVNVVLADLDGDAVPEVFAASAVPTGRLHMWKRKRD